MEQLASDLYVAVVQPDTIWWDDLPQEMKDAWLRAARVAIGRRVPSIREVAARHGIPLREHDIPPDVGGVAPFADDFGPQGLTAEERHEVALKERGWLDEYEAETATAQSYGEGVAHERGRLRAALRRELHVDGRHGFPLGFTFEDLWRLLTAPEERQESPKLGDAARATDARSGTGESPSRTTVDAATTLLASLLEAEALRASVGVTTNADYWPNLAARLIAAGVRIGREDEAYAAGRLAGYEEGLNAKPPSLIPFDPTEPEEFREERRIAESVGLPGFYVGNTRRGEMSHDLCSEHGWVGSGVSIIAHLKQVHGIEYGEYKRRIAGVAPLPPTRPDPSKHGI